MWVRLSRVLLGTIIGLLLCGSAAAASTNSLTRWGFVVAGDSSSMASLRAHASDLDVVAPTYYKLDPQGHVSGSNNEEIDQVTRAAGAQLLPIVNDSASGNALSPVFDSPAITSDVVASLAQIAAQNNDDGLTLDLEGINPSDRATYTAFVKRVADRLHADGRSLAVTVPAKTSDRPTIWGGAYNDAVLAAAVDDVIVMAYGYRTNHSSQPGSIAPLSWVRAVASYSSAVMPPDKIIFGLGLWGYDWVEGSSARATTRAFPAVRALSAIYPGTSGYSTADASAWFRYGVNGQSHVVWYEDQVSIATKIAVAGVSKFAGVAFWRLGQEDPAIWQIQASPGPADYAIPDGWFFGETGGAAGRGYTVVDDGRAHFWTEFRRLGGVATLGFPVSQPYQGSDGFYYQACQRAVLQWRPELDQAVLANTFEQLTAAGRDAWLLSIGVPAPIGDDGSGGDWNQAQRLRLAWLTDPAIAAKYWANPNPGAIADWNIARSISLYGLPSSAPVKSGPFIVQRFQRMSLQLWVDDVPGMPPKGTVVGILGGDLLKQSGLVPPDSALPIAAPLAQAWT